MLLGLSQMLQKGLPPQSRKGEEGERREKEPLLSEPVIGSIFSGFNSALQTELLQRQTT